MNVFEFAGALCLLCALLVGVAIMAPRVNDGVVPKIGLIAVAVGLLAMGLQLLEDTPSLRALTNGVLVVTSGVCVAAAGAVFRFWRGHRAEWLKGWLR